ncbi:tagaturonate reductase [Paenibacillus sp. FSL W8-1187]|uniref:tagaturonate reductase n=1 Tax=Paenibacillus sp. FSL W8-1187 TaxID=2975339 RepID=UPI0030D6E6BC
MASLLTETLLAAAEDGRFTSAGSDPVRVLQVGEGNFLRGFVDWMLDGCRKQGLFPGSVAVVQPRRSGKRKIEKLAAQDGLFTLVIRGLEGGERIERRSVVSVFSNVLDPYEEWASFLALADGAELRFVVSNTTEAGLAYRSEPMVPGEAPESFPAKMTLLLLRRYETFAGAPDKGLIFLPCELLERNGDRLREGVLRHAEEWGLPEAFQAWVREHNRFLSTLVDRIVTGYPDAEEAERWFERWGYRDELLTTGEPYHLWAIEAEPELDEELPLRQAGFNVHWTPDLKPFQQRKVRILNGAHTLMTPLGLLHGVEHVRELMEHPELGSFVRNTVEAEIIPSLPEPAEAMKAYAAEVYERYLNPHLRHRLSDIAMNSISKAKARLLPSMAYYAEKGEPVPAGLALGFAALLRYYRVERIGDGYEGRSFAGEPYRVADDAELLGRIEQAWSADCGEREKVRRLLADETVWGIDLSAWKGLAEAVADHLAGWERKEA